MIVECITNKEIHVKPLCTTKTGWFGKRQEPRNFNIEKGLPWSENRFWDLIKDVRTQSRKISPSYVSAKCPHCLKPLSSLRTHPNFQEIKFFATKSLDVRIWRTAFYLSAGCPHWTNPGPRYTCSFICQGIKTRRQQRNLFVYPVKLPPVTTILAIQS